MTEILEWIRYVLCAASLAAGLFFEITAITGVYRFRYAINRLHAAALGDTMGMFFFFLGLIIAGGWSFISLKIALLVILFWVASPVSSHMIARLEYETSEQLKKEATEWKS